jgi:hypothetical protein
MSKIFAPFIRSLAFVRKEVVEVVRQPRLVATLILGPFLILLLFGLGYRSEMPALRTLFVGDPESPLAEEVTAGLEDFGGGDLEFAAVNTITGKGTFKAKIATNDAAAIAHSQLFFSAREPIRWAACTTIAVTAGLIP